MPTVRTSRIFTKYSGLNLSKFLGKTSTCLLNNAAYTDPEFTPAELDALRLRLDGSLIKADRGGVLDTAAKNAVMVEANSALSMNASYVDIYCNNDLVTLLSSGYEAVSTNRAQGVLDAPQIIGVDYAASGSLRVRVTADANTKSFVGHIRTFDEPEFGPNLSFQNSRKIIFNGLTPGVVYVLQVCAIGGLNGQSDWSDTATKMAL